MGLAQLLEPRVTELVEGLSKAEAIAKLELICGSSRDPGPWVLLGDLTREVRPYECAVEEYVKRGFRLKAIAILKELVKLEPNVVRHHARLATLYSELGLFTDARPHLDVVASRQGNSTTKEEMQAVLAGFPRERNDIAEFFAAARRTRMIDRDPDEDDIEASIELAPSARRAHLHDGGAPFLEDEHVEEELDGYRLGEKIGEGGWGAVFRGRQIGEHGFERVVAMKRMRRELASSSEYVRMMVDEAKLALSISHENVARVLDLVRSGDEYFIAMEHVDGFDLRLLFHYVRKNHFKLPVALVCYVVMKVCEGVDYAHDLRGPDGKELFIVHRDVTPSNVLLSTDGDVKLTDFGLAYTNTRNGQLTGLVGKFGYMSPEQVQGLPVDRRTDIFSIGVMLYELLTMQRAFDGTDVHATLERVRDVALMPPSEIDSRIHDSLEQTVLRALAKNPEDRFQTAIDLHDELQAYAYTADEMYSRQQLAAFIALHADALRAFAKEFRKTTADEASRFQSFALGSRPPPPRRPSPVREDEGSVSYAVRLRVGEGTSVSNVRAFELHQLGARNTEEAARAKRPEVAHARRLEAAAKHVQAVEAALTTRLLRAFPAAERDRWREVRSAANVNVSASRDRKLEEFLVEGTLPSLAMLATWLKPQTAPRPAELAQTIQSCLGLTATQRPALHALGSLRIVLAHLIEYENQPDKAIGPSDEFLSFEIVDGRRVFDLTQEALDQLEAVCAEILRNSR